MTAPDLRFNKGDLHSLLARQSEVVAEAVRTLDPDTSLVTPVDDLTDQLYERHRVEAIELRLDRRTSKGARDLNLSVESWTGRTVNVDGTRVEILIPFEGDAVLLDIRASTFNYNPPRFDVRGSSIVAAYEARAPIDKEQAKASIEELIKQIQQHVDW